MFSLCNNFRFKNDGSLRKHLQEKDEKGFYWLTGVFHHKKIAKPENVSSFNFVKKIGHFEKMADIDGFDNSSYLYGLA